MSIVDNYVDEIVKSKNLKLGTKSTEKYIEQLEKELIESNPVSHLCGIYDSNKALFAQTLVTQEGIQTSHLSSFYIVKILKDGYYANSKIATWLKEKYISRKNDIIKFLKLTHNILSANAFQLPNSSILAKVWLWIDKRIANHGYNAKENYIAFWNKYVLIDAPISPSTVISLISKAEAKLTIDEEKAISFSAQMCQIWSDNS